MSKKFKSLICTLLAGMMLATSAGITALAEDAAETVIDENGAEVAATEVPETFNGADIPEDEKDPMHLEETPAEETAPTEAPAVNGYDNDTYYQNALKVVSALGIITGYEDGSIKPESTVTRAEMATIVLRMLAQTANSTYQNVFTDLEASHWAADTIQTAVEQGILDGMGDGTFVPDGNVKYEQVLKMIVCAMNYGTDAENAGGYPQGYVSVGGTTLKLLTGVKGATGTDMPRGEVIKTVYNALLASYREITDFKNGLPVYTAKDTLGVALFDMYEDEGLLTTTENITIATGAKTKAGIVTIDGVDYKCSFNVDEYVGTKIKFYYIDDKADDPQIIALFSMGKSTEYTFDADDIESIDTAAGSIKVYKSSTSTATSNYKINNATVIYNGTILSTADYTKYIGGSDYDGFITPDVGTVKIVDYDNDGTYDIIFVESYETMLVTTASTEKLTGKIKNVNTTIEYDLDDNDYTITVTKSGSAATVKNLKKNDVASIKRNIESDTIDIVVTGESINGEITSVGEDDGDTTITVNGQVYKVDENAIADVRTGISGSFYLDMFDRIGYIDSNGALTGSEKYAMITKAFYNDENELVIRLYTQEGTEIEAKPANSMSFWAPGATETSRATETELYNVLNEDSNYIQCGTSPVKLCKYTLNSSGDLSKLHVAVEATTANISNGALTLYNNNMNGVATVGGTLNGYSINDGIVEFSVPDNEDDRGSGANYSTGTVTASNYKSYDGGVNIDFVIGGFTGSSTKTAEVLVKFTTSSTSVWEIKELDTATTVPSMIISKINESVDADGDTIFEIKGYSGGTEVSYMTMDTTGIYKFTGFGNDADYHGDRIFNATSDDASKIYSVIQPGDVVALATNGSNIKVIVKMADINDVAALAVTGSSSDTVLGALPYAASAKNSATREYYYMGFISSVEIDDSAFIGYSDVNGATEYSVSYDTSSAFSYATVTVNESGKITNVKVDKTGGLEPAELYGIGEEDNTFDFGVFTSMRGNMGNGYVIRVVIDR
ncbi:MAG: S-layer homology domain-containing protein [Candidatus Ornithomonoglobus sp.]